MQLQSLIIITSIVGFSACNRGDDKPAAQVVQPSAAPSANALAAGRTYTFSNADSKLEFVGSKITGKNPGSFGAFRGKIVVPDLDLTRSGVTVEVETGSLTADIGKLTAHLKSADFLDVEHFPTAIFRSSAVEVSTEAGATHRVTGELTLHGVTKTLRFPATIRASEQAVDVQSEFSFNRKDFGIVYPGKPDDLISDDVVLKLELHAKP
jgi:polyisoprenoid-binding protein YceI